MKNICGLPIFPYNNTGTSREDFMQAIKIMEIVKKDSELKMSGLPLRKGQRVEMIVMTEPLITESVGATAQNLLKSKIVGLWKDRPIEDSAMYARILRDETQDRVN
jgi:hypothetical protein